MRKSGEAAGLGFEAWLREPMTATHSLGQEMVGCKLFPARGMRMRIWMNDVDGDDYD